MMNKQTDGQMILLSFVVLYDYFLCVNMCICHVYF